MSGGSRHLEGLPAELNGLIAGDLEQRDFAHLCLVNRHLNAVWAQFLYQEFTESPFVSPRAYLGKIRAYATNAHLRPHLKKVMLFSGPAARLGASPSASWQSTMNRGLQSIANPLRNFDRSQMMYHAGMGDVDAIGAALLHFCPHVRRATIELMPVHNANARRLYHTGDYIIRSLLPPYNTAIAELKVLHDPSAYTWQWWTHWSPVMHGPRLTHLHLDSFSFDNTNPSMTPYTRTLTHFKVFESDLDAYALGLIIHPSQNLYELSVRNVDETQFDAARFSWCSPWRYGPVLGAMPGITSPRMGSLRKLTLMSALTDYDSPLSRNHTLTFRNFPHLADITISDWLLFDQPQRHLRPIYLADMLPRALERLKIYPSDIAPQEDTPADEYRVLSQQFGLNIERELAEMVTRDLFKFPRLQLVVAPRFDYIEVLFGRGTSGTAQQYHSIPRGFAWRRPGFVPDRHERLWLALVEPVDTYAKCLAHFRSNLHDLSLFDIADYPI